jgi:DNA-binding transcriptional LysR family regulator
MKKHEGLELNIDVTNKATVLHTLEQNEIDFALVSIKPEKFETEGIELMENELYLVSSMPLKSKKIQASDLNKFNLIFREEGSATRQMMESFLKKQGIQKGRHLELSSNEAVKQAVMSGLGVSIMPIIGIKNEIKLKQLFVIPLQGLPIKTRWQLIWLKNKNHSPAAKAFIDYIKTNRELLTKSSFLG